MGSRAKARIHTIPCNGHKLDSNALFRQHSHLVSDEFLG